MRLLLLLALVGCSLPHVDPAPRLQGQAEATTVRVDVTCSEPAPFKTGEPTDPHRFDPDVVWAPPSTGTGVIISERHVLTAGHVVHCPVIPIVHVTLQDGRRYSMYVERDDAMYGSGSDVARLVMASADRFHLNIPPPELGIQPEPDSYAIARVLGRRVPVGTFTGFRREIRGMTTRHGDSGAGVYNMSGQLIGIIVIGADDGSYSRYEPITPYWLEGT